MENNKQNNKNLGKKIYNILKNNPKKESKIIIEPFELVFERLNMSKKSAEIIIKIIIY